MHFIEKYGLMAIKVPSKFDLRRFCRATGAAALCVLRCAMLRCACRAELHAARNRAQLQHAKRHTAPALQCAPVALHAELRQCSLQKLIVCGRGLARCQRTAISLARAGKQLSYGGAPALSCSLLCRRHRAGEAGHPLCRRAGPGQEPGAHRDWRHQVHRAAAGERPPRPCWAGYYNMSPCAAIYLRPCCCAGMLPCTACAAGRERAGPRCTLHHGSAPSLPHSCRLHALPLGPSVPLPTPAPAPA